MNKKIALIITLINACGFGQEANTMTGINPLTKKNLLTTDKLIKIHAVQKRNFNLLPGEKVISLVFSDNKRLHLREQLARKCDFIKTALDDFNTDNKTIILPSKIPFSQLSVKQFFFTLANNNFPKEPKKIKKIAQVADYFVTPYEYNEQLAKVYITHVNPVDFGPEAEHFYTYSGFKNYIENRLQNLTDEERNRELGKVFGKNSLSLQGQKDNQISSLHDISRIPLKYLTEKEINNITEVDFSKNNLRAVHIDSLLGMFPKLKKLNLAHNNIATVNLTQLDLMPDGFELNLSGNNIIEFVRSTQLTIPHECTVIVDRRYEPLIKHFKQTNSLLPKVLINCYAPTSLLTPLKMTFAALSTSNSLASAISLVIPIGLQLVATVSLTLKAIMPAIQSVEDLTAIKEGITLRGCPAKKNYLKVPNENGHELVVVEDMKAKTALLIMQMARDLAKLKK